jgi:hypothetical protein
MKWLLPVVIAIPLVAQDVSQTPPAKDASQTSPAKDASQTPPSNPASPVPSTENWVSGWVEVGYRWRTDVAGSFDTYRSIVNLGAGPKLLGTEFTVIDPKHRMFDRIDVRGYNWGDDPYGTLHVRITKSKDYEFNADYRDIAYFNFLPSFADPLLARGYILNQQSFDTRRRMGNLELELMPGSRIVPYLGFERNSGTGTGVNTFYSDGNQYPVPTDLHDQTNLFRGGVRLEWRKLHATLEQGGTTFKDDQTLFQSGGVNYGDINTPVLGHVLSLYNVLAAYGIRGTSIYSKVLVSAHALSWLDVYGQFLYSQPESSTNYQHVANGNLFLQSAALFYNTQQFVASSEAKLPHTTGSAGAEIRPIRKVRILQSWLTDRLHNASDLTSLQRLISPTLSQTTTAFLTAGLITNYNQVETMVIWDALPRLTLRGGYRHVWGDASQAILPPAGLASADQGELRRNIVIGGLTYRPTKKLTITGDAEGAPGDQAYFRTSIYEYQKARAQVRYQIRDDLTLSGDFNLLNNQNPTPGIHYDYLARQQSVAAWWSPAGNKRFDLQGAYTRATTRSDILFLIPQTLTPADSVYRENSHILTGLAIINLPQTSGLAPKLTAGGSVFLSSGSRPTHYYQPNLKLSLPTGKKLDWFAEWRYYGFGEPFYLYEGFRTHIVTAGVRITR